MVCDGSSFAALAHRPLAGRTEDVPMSAMPASLVHPVVS